MEKSIWLTMMRDRLKQIERLLHPRGSIWIHCDDSMGAHPLNQHAPEASSAAV